jgi:hypothetical protein
MKKAVGLLSILLFLLPVENALAVDSYRFLHVTIETPWLIFIFLLFIVLFPFVLTAILYWYYAGQKKHAESSDK